MALAVAPSASDGLKVAQQVEKYDVDLLDIPSWDVLVTCATCPMPGLEYEKSDCADAEIRSMLLKGVQETLQNGGSSAHSHAKSPTLGTSIVAAARAFEVNGGPQFIDL